MLSSRGVIAVMAVITFGLAFIALQREAPRTAFWLLAAGSAIAGVWSALSVIWAGSHPSLAPPDGYLSLTMMALVTTLYFVIRARD